LRKKPGLLCSPVNLREEHSQASKSVKDTKYIFNNPDFMRTEVMNLEPAKELLSKKEFKPRRETQTDRGLQET
jgi:hypothetical protein